MIRNVDRPKARPHDVACAIFAGMVADHDEIFLDPLSATLAAAWSGGALKAMELANARYLELVK